VVHRPFGPGELKEIRRKPPTAIVVDLSRMPMQGRDAALALREAAPLRRVPLVFLGGEPEKVAGIEKVLPDAVYATWRGFRGALRRAIDHPPAEVGERTRMAGYSGTPLPKKLGIKEGATVALVSAPVGFEKTLGPLPRNVRLNRRAAGKPDLVIWFTRSRKELTTRIDDLGVLAGAGGLWIAWPKKASGVQTDVDQTLVRHTGLGAGLVDFKICAIDDTWSGLRFARRKRKQ